MMQRERQVCSLPSHTLGNETAPQLPTRPLAELRLPDAGRASLLAANGRTMKGDARDPLTPLADSHPNGRNGIRDDLTELAIQGVPEPVKQLEMDESAQVGPIHPQLPWSERRDSILPYWYGRTFSADNRRFAEATKRVKALIGPIRLRPTSYEVAADSLPKGTNLGLPWLTRQRRHLDLSLIHI